MGIKCLNQLLNKICGTSHVSIVPMCNFSGKRIAIDASLYLYIFKTRNNFVRSVVDFLTLLRQHNIHPFFVFDGVAPEEKRAERATRAEKRAVARERIRSLERDLETYKQTGTMSSLLESLHLKTRKLAVNRISVSCIQAAIDKLKTQVLSLTPQDFNTMKTLLTAFNIPFTTADGEGEFLCAALARHGIVDTVMSSDTDVLTCLAPTVITKIDGENFYVVSLKAVLDGLHLSEKEFIDLCIMCGTDFNTNIDNIGAARSYNLILKYKSIENIPPDIDTSCLRYKRVREIFSYSDVPPSMYVPYSGTPDYSQLADYDPEIIKQKLKRPIVRM